MIPQILFTALLAFLAVSESICNARHYRTQANAVAGSIGTIIRYAAIAALAVWGGFYD